MGRSGGRCAASFRKGMAEQGIDASAWQGRVERGCETYGSWRPLGDYDASFRKGWVGRRYAASMIHCWVGGGDDASFRKGRTQHDYDASVI